jgi:hypothetical protein
VVITYRRVKTAATVASAYTFHSEVFAVTAHRINFRRYNSPVVVFEYHALQRTKRINFSRYNDPIKVFGRTSIPIPNTIPFEARLSMPIELEVDGGAISREATLDTTISLVVDATYGLVITPATLSMVISLICIPNSTFTPEECFTDEDIDIADPSPRKNRWF